MVAARIAVVLVAALLPFAGAQLPQQTEITIQVTDVTGAVIPAARIQIDPAPSPLQSTFIADSRLAGAEPKDLHLLRPEFQARHASVVSRKFVA
jgi:hypothetical protein